MLEPTNLAGRTAIVTGAGQGIGLAIAEALLAAGAHVLAVDREPAGIEALAARPQVTAVRGDVTDPDLPQQIGAVLDGARTRLDILVNNAGIARGAHALHTGDEDFTRYFDINVLGLFRLSRWAVQRMMGAGGGAIVNTASIFGLIGAQNSCGYSASKAAVIGLTRQMATDFGPNGIRVNAVAPGLIETPLTAERIRSEPWRRHQMIDGCPLRRVGKPEDVARAVRFLASDEASFITGHVLTVDGGWAIGCFPEGFSMAQFSLSVARSVEVEQKSHLTRRLSLWIPMSFHDLSRASTCLMRNSALPCGACFPTANTEVQNGRVA